MNHFLRLLLCVAGLEMAGVHLGCASLHAQTTDQRLEKVLEDWQRRQNYVDVVRYQVRGERKYLKGAYNAIRKAVPDMRTSQDIPPEDLNGDVGFSLLLDFRNGRHRKETKEQNFGIGSGKLAPQVIRSTFDGSVMKSLMPREQNPGLDASQPELTIVSGNMKNGAFPMNYYPIFFGHGRIYTVIEGILPGQLRKKPEPSYLVVHGVGAHDGRSCLVIRTQVLKLATTSFDEYWVDPAKDSAIVRYLSYSANKATNDIAIHYSKSPVRWLPESWSWTNYVQGKVAYSEHIKVTALIINPMVSDSDFDIEVTPGMVVEERTDYNTSHPLTSPKSKLQVYHVEEGGSHKEIPDLYRREGDQYGSQHKWWRAWTWLAVPLVVAVCLIFYRTIRQKRFRR